MIKQDENLKFNKSMNNNSNKKQINPQNQRDEIKAKLINKYNISIDEAEEILSRIEKKRLHEINEKTRENSKNQNNLQTNNVSINKQVLKRNDNENNNKNRNSKGINQKSDKNVENTNSNKKQGTVVSTKSNVSIENNNSESVDSILGNIINDYDKQISIKVDHVDLTFEVQNEKIDTIKEAVVRTLKRDKSKKIKIHALNDVSFQIYKGEKIGIIGYNGAGKSTLLNVITGIYPPDKGSVTTYGNISPLLSLGAGFDHNFSGRKNIILNGAVLGYDKKYLESKLDEIIEFSELGEFIDIPIKNYSSGMLAKLGFSIATTVNPDILIIDEILGVGDVNFKKKSADKIRSLMDGGTTVLLVSHSIPQIRDLCDKAIWIDKGSVKAFGEVNKVCDEYLKDSEKASAKQLANIKLTE